jgi:tRNA dimethylallyltransferase
MVREVKNLLKQKVSHKRLFEMGLEYRFVSQYLQGKLSYDEMKEQLKSAIHKFSKRQMTWFKS